VDDLFSAQGYVQAWDRSWQMESWRLAGNGRLAEFVGASSVGSDKCVCALGLRRAARADWENASDDENPLLTAFSVGFHAFIDSHGWKDSSDARDGIRQVVDGKLGTDSVGGAILEATYQQLARNTLGNKLDADLFNDYLYHGDAHRAALLALLEKPNGDW
jgi:acyl-homoserine lactone acylase PvdQ